MQLVLSMQTPKPATAPAIDGRAALAAYVFDDDVRCEIERHASSRVLVDALAEAHPDLLESLARDLLDFEAPVMVRFRELDLEVAWKHERGPVAEFAAVRRELADATHEALSARGWTWEVG